MSKQTPTQAIKQGKEWVERNPEAYKSLKNLAKRMAKRHPGRDLRISPIVEQVRYETNASVPNACRAYLARRIEGELRTAGVMAKFTRSKSKIDDLMEGQE